jgi:hypothetical protein
MHRTWLEEKQLFGDWRPLRHKVVQVVQVNARKIPSTSGLSS